MDINYHVRTLLDKQENVTLPRLGTFYVSKVSAFFDEDKKHLSPPSKQVVFKQDLKAIDDKLAIYIAKVENITVNEAKEAVNTYIAECRDILKSKHEIYFDKLGTLLIQRRTLRFVAESPQKPTDKTEELHPIDIKPVEKAVSETKKTDKHKKTKTTVRKSNFWTELALPLLVLLIIFAFLAYIIINPNNFSDLNLKYSGLLPLISYSDHEDDHSSVQSTKILKQENIIEDQTPHEKADDITTVDSKATQEAKQNAQQKAQKKKPQSTSKKYHIIVSSMEYKTMADVHAKKLIEQGYKEAIVIGPNDKGNYRISIESYKDKSKALKQLKAIQKEITPSAWLLYY